MPSRRSYGGCWRASRVWRSGDRRTFAQRHWAARPNKAHVGAATVAGNDVVRDLAKQASADIGGHKFSLHFLMTECAQVVDTWQMADWESYRDVARLERKTPAHRLIPGCG